MQHQRLQHEQTLLRQQQQALQLQEALQKQRLSSQRPLAHGQQTQVAPSQPLDKQAYATRGSLDETDMFAPRTAVAASDSSGLLPSAGKLADHDEAHVPLHRTRSGNSRLAASRTGSATLRSVGGFYSDISGGGDPDAQPGVAAAPQLQTASYQSAYLQRKLLQSVSQSARPRRSVSVASDGGVGGGNASGAESPARLYSTLRVVDDSLDAASGGGSTFVATSSPIRSPVLGGPDGSHSPIHSRRR
jgi:hypothetical protein